MNILALDPALNCTGVAFYDGEIDAITTSLFKPRTTERLPRLTRHFYFLWRHLAESPLPPNLVVLEDYAFAVHGASTYQIGEMGGIIRLALAWAKVPHVFVNPGTLKMVATGKGNSKKDAVLSEAIRRLGYQGTSHDEADALWLLQLALHAYEHPAALKLPQAHLRAVERVEWPKVTPEEELEF